ncbi:MAG: acyl-CoA dehydrogenase [Gammaproteobacteria bacterium]|nr:MAG: acyl-CoA dehydrogenase [Chloroflexota bacterium]TDJ23131.1 MAG: acyl-CoA dehydrogenase [Gammaproteobacteria bacterium]
MSWGFDTDPEFQRELDWMEDFVATEVAPIEMVLSDSYDVTNPNFIKLVRPLQAIVKERGLWACHLGPELGGPGFGQLKLALMNEILGKASFAPIVFGCQAPDSGNGEILAHYGTEEHKEKYLRPLLDGEIVSCFSMTEPHAGADPTMFKCAADQDGDEWVINGEKWFSSNAKHASFLIVMAVSDPDAPPHSRMSMFIVPTDTPGINIIRNAGIGGEPMGEGHHAYIRYENVRIPAANMLGERGQAFIVAQTRLGGGRIHHAMRTVGQLHKAFDMMCQRVLSRETKGEVLAQKQSVQEKIADSWIEMEQFRLLVLRTAWRIDKYQDYRRVRKDIAAIKALMPKVYHDVISRALHLHGSLGISNEMPFTGMLLGSYVMGLADGPTEVHKVTVARQVLGEYTPTNDLFPDYHLPRRRDAALAKFADLIDLEIGQL